MRIYSSQWLWTASPHHIRSVHPPPAGKRSCGTLFSTTKDLAGRRRAMHQVYLFQWTHYCLETQIHLSTVKMDDMTAPPKVKVKLDRPLVADCIISHKPLTSDMSGDRTRAEPEPRRTNQITFAFFFHYISKNQISTTTSDPFMCQSWRGSFNGAFRQNRIWFGT